MPAVNNAFTNLKLIGIGVAPYSARGLTQTLDPIQQSIQMRRTVNGVLKDISMDQFRKYTSTISGADQEPPVCDGVWPGRIVVVECLAPLRFITGNLPSREVVEDSAIEQPDGTTIYRPRLTMMVLNLSLSAEEYTVGHPWTMTLEEV